jgi:hypothetical protein
MKTRPLLALVLAWLLPGAGHWYIGQRVKAVLFCFILVAMFAAGVLITEGGCIDPGRHPWALALQAFDGLPAAAALVVTWGAAEFPASKLADLGMLLTLVAGGLNVLLMADALYRAAPGEAREGE